MNHVFAARLRQMPGLAVIDLSGEINAFADQELDVVYTEAEGTGSKAILLNFGNVTYINSTGIALIVGLLARYTDLITLQAPWNALENPWVLGVLVVLLAIEMTVDKIPAADTVNDVIQTVIRPAAGAILFAASGNVISEMSPVLAMIDWTKSSEVIFFCEGCVTSRSLKYAAYLFGSLESK